MLEYIFSSAFVCVRRIQAVINGIIKISIPPYPQGSLFFSCSSRKRARFQSQRQLFSLKQKLPTVITHSSTATMKLFTVLWRSDSKGDESEDFSFGATCVEKAHRQVCLIWHKQMLQLGGDVKCLCEPYTIAIMFFIPTHITQLFHHLLKKGVKGDPSRWQPQRGW